MAEAPPSPPRVLCVDDENGVRSALRRELHGYAVEQAASAEQAREVLRDGAPDVIICDMRMPNEDGISLLSWVAEQHPQVVRILLTGYGDYQTSRRAINNGRVFALLEKPWDRDELQETIRAGLEVQRQTSEQGALEAQFAEPGGDLSAYFPLLESLTQLEAHQPGHSVRVAEALEAFGRFLKLNDARAMELRAAALAHSLGELTLSDACRRTPQLSLNGPLRQEFQSHPERAAAVLRATPALQSLAPIVAAQHERYDGSGFPAGLQGDAIPVPARLLAVVDMYDAARHGRLRARALSEAETRKYLQAQAGTQLDPRVVNAFLRFLQQSEAPSGAAHGLPIDELTPGMVLEKDLLTAGGILLAPAGHRLTPALLDRIRALAQLEAGSLSAVVRQQG